jgi:hypothetical protein
MCSVGCATGQKQFLDVKSIYTLEGVGMCVIVCMHACIRPCAEKIVHEKISMID